MTAQPAFSQSESDSHEEGPGYQPRQLVLLGAGHAHLHVLAHLARNPLIGVRIILVTPHARQMYAAMVPGFVAGHYPMDDCSIPLEPLVRRSGVRWLQRSVRALSATDQTVVLDDGSTLHYDWLSVNTGPIQNRELVDRSIPGARTHGLFMRPLEAFGALWPRVRDMGDARPLRIAVIGGGAAGVEVAMAVHHRLPNAAVTLVAGPQGPGASYPARMQQDLLLALKQRGVTVLQDIAVSITAAEVQLGCGAGLACDVPLLATGPQPPLWLSGCGLALDAAGYISVDACQRSTSHGQVFAAGDVSTRIDCALARSGVYAVHAGPTLAANLAAATAGANAKPHSPPRNTLNIVTCGEQYAIATWGAWGARGKWVWWLKNWIDRRFVARYNHAQP